MAKYYLSYKLVVLPLNFNMDHLDTQEILRYKTMNDKLMYSTPLIIINKFIPTHHGGKVLVCTNQSLSNKSHQNFLAYKKLKYVWGGLDDLYIKNVKGNWYKTFETQISFFKPTK